MLFFLCVNYERNGLVCNGTILGFLVVGTEKLEVQSFSKVISAGATMACIIVKRERKERTPVCRYVMDPSEI